ncbi:MAG: adenylate/guanylate cyclase domain-containing protein [Tepidiformaceae bacterium]
MPAVLAIFEGPSRAVRCGLELHDAVKSLDLDVRVGMHVGEVELRGDDVSGIAVHIAARVAAAAGDGETLVSSTVKDLVAGSGFRFEDRGMRALKGVPEEWRLFAASG